MDWLAHHAHDVPIIWLAVIASVIGGLASGVGAFPVLVLPRISRRVQDTLLGFSAGVMLAASAFSLVLPGIEAARSRYGGGLGGLAAATGLLVGAVGLYTVHRTLPHEHFIKGRESADQSSLRRIWLFVLAITLHHFPEGLSIGVSYGATDLHHGFSMTIAVFLQNLPEGLAVGLAVLPQYGRLRSVLIALATGAVQTVGGLTGAFAVSFATAALPWALTAAAGAMLFVISHEIIPETHRNGHDTSGTFGVIVGFAVMMLLDVVMQTV